MGAEGGRGHRGGEEVTRRARLFDAGGGVARAVGGLPGTGKTTDMSMLLKSAGGWRKAALGIIAVTGLALAGLVGCGRLGEKTAIIEWYSAYFEKYYVRWIEDFERAHAGENVRIKFRAMPSNSTQKVYTMLISHTLSDVTEIGPGTAFLLLDEPVLEPVAEGDVDRDDYLPLALRLASRSDGTLMGYPTGADMRGFVYYNRAYLDEAGTSAAEAPETFDEYIPWARRLFAWDVDGRVVHGVPSEDEMKSASLLRRPIGMTRGYFWSSLSFIFAYMDPLPDENGVSDGSIDDYIGGPPSMRPFRFDTPEFVEGVREYQRFFLPKQTAIADGDTSRMNGFLRGIYSGMEGSNWIYGEIDTVDLQVTRFPHAEGRPMRTWMNSGSVGVSRESKHKKLAVEWAKYISSADSLVDAYYGHGYTPSRLSAWKRLKADADVDIEIRSRFLGGFTGETEGYVGLPQVKRRYHDMMDVILYVPYWKDVTLLRVRHDAAVEETPEVPAAGGQDAAAAETVAQEAPRELKPATTGESAGELAKMYLAAATRLQRDVAAFTGQKVSVIVQGTPQDMVPSRSYVIPSPIPTYAPMLEGSGVWVPYDLRWNRISAEVITRALQFATRDENPMTPEEAAKWAQKEAEDILAGKK